MSPTITSLPVKPKDPKGQRIPGKKKRFDPDVEFHMSTRTGAKKKEFGGASSTNGSVEDLESRRPSLDAERPVTAHSTGTQASKATFASDFSPPQPVPDIEMADAPPATPSGVSFDGEPKPRSLSPVVQTTPIIRKRKRSSPSPPPARLSDEIAHVNGGGSDARLGGNDYDSDTVEVVHQDQLSDRDDSGDEGSEEKIESSPGSSQSHEALPTYNAMVGTSFDVTPILSEQPSPATSGSAEDEDQNPAMAIAKPLAAALKSVVEAEKDGVAEPEAAEDAPMLDVAQAIEDADDIEEQLRTDEDGRMVVRRGRFGGRRRAQHPNVNIEVAMRRQAQLKTAYRAIARVQKNVLAEVTQRTIDDLEVNPKLHTEVAEYREIMRGLDAALAERKATIQAQHNLRHEQLRTTWEGEKDVIVATCQQQLRGIEENKVDQLQYEFLRIARSAQLEDGNDTEDEDDVIPRLKHAAYRFKRGVGLDPAYDSRSRLAMETQRASNDMEARYNMYEMLKQLSDDDKPDKHNAFAVMDERPRTAADRNREGMDILDLLVAAGNETERIASIPVIPNEQALGLQILGDLSTRPSITGGWLPRSGSASAQLSGARTNLQSRLQAPRGASPIQVQMSPRTQHAMSNRFDPVHMPPPSTPLQESGATILHSAEPRQQERNPSPPSKEQRHNGSRAPSNEDSLRSLLLPQAAEVNDLHHRIASRDSMLQDSLFGMPDRHDRRFQDHPGWRPFDAHEGTRRRAASHGNLGAPVGIRSDPLMELRHEQEHDDARRPRVNDEVKSKTTMFDPVRSQTLRWPDQHSQAGANHGRNQETASPKSERLSVIGTPGPQNQSHQDQDNSTGGKTSRHHKGGSKTGMFPHKTSKAERKGVPRRQFGKDKKHQHQLHEIGRPESGGTPTVGSTRYAGSPPIDIRARSPWLGGGPPILSPHDYPPGPGPYHHGGSYGLPPPHAFPRPLLQHHASSFDDYHHQTSFLPPPPTSLGFNGPAPPSPLYSIPPQHPPPPGIEQYHHPFGPAPLPPPPSGLQHLPGFSGPPPPHTPHTPHPQSAPGSGSQHIFRGTPIAPAGAYQPGVRPHNPAAPVFEQLQQQSGGGSNGGHRRRTQSDSHGLKFQQPWVPKPPRD